MRNKIYISILIFCAIFTQGIADSSEESIGTSSDHRSRKKRLIDKTESQKKIVPILQVPYIVIIQQRRRFQPKIVTVCAGSILAPEVILTAAHCVFDKKSEYFVLSGSRLRYYEIRHNLTEIIINSHYNHRDFSNDLALIKIFPKLDLQRTYNSKIDLFHGYIFPRTFGTVSGWGCVEIRPWNQMIFSEQLRTIHMPIISKPECHNAYLGITRITNKQVCTLDRTGRKGSCEGDGGDPLVVRGKLLGVMSFRKGIVNGRNPDVFVNLNEPEYKAWVATNLEILSA